MGPITVIFIFSTMWILCSSLSHSCLHSIDGKHYSGDINVTMSRKLCIPWSVAKDKYSLSRLQIKSYQDNFCRNPNGSDSTWCYTSHDKMEKCYIPMCSVNPKANYCISVPKIHFTVCPSLLSKILSFQNYGFKRMVFCCASNNSDVIDALPRNTCLLVVIDANDVMELFTPCPDGFGTRSITDKVLEGNVIYKCCKAEDSSMSLIKGLDSNISSPILASVAPYITLCQELIGSTVATVEYHEMDRLSNGILPSKVTICYYYTNNRSANIFYHSQLGFMSHKECPHDFIESYESSSIITYGSQRMKFCWPKNHSFVYASGNICLNTRPETKGFHICPENFQSFDMLSAFSLEHLPKFCCRYQLSWSNDTLGTIEVTKNVSISFIAPSDKCPIYQANVSIKGFLIKATVKRNVTITSHNNPTLYTPVISLCSYDFPKDEFAYKMIGQHCPMRMFASKVVVKLVTDQETRLTDDKFVTEFCVGNIAFTGQSFPNGKYCVYKIGRQCPLGFDRKSLSQRRFVIETQNLVPDYDHDTLCCRNDGSNQTIGSMSIPFVHSNQTASFGLILLNNYDICPNISTFISYQDFDIDGPYCAYRSEEEYYKWKNEIIWPQTMENFKNNIKIINTTVETHWKSLHPKGPVKYRSSIIHKFPKGEFCILSQSGCLSINGVNFSTTYPIKGLSICCILSSDSSKSAPIVSFDLKMKGKHLIGYISLRRKCPTVDPNVFVLQQIVNDQFEIDNKYFKESYGHNLLKIGIIPDLVSNDRFVKVDFQFCVFQRHDQAENNDKSKVDNLFEFIKPTTFICPEGFNEIHKNIVIDPDDELDPLSQHFIANSFISMCVSAMTLRRKRILRWPGHLCEVSLAKCSSEISININGSQSDEPLHICCSKVKESHNTSDIILSQFSLPLHPDENICPNISNHSSLIWKLPLQQRYHHFCYYYKPIAPVAWPTGNYFTVAYNMQCPVGFRFMEYNGTGLCFRRNTKPSVVKFPTGNYCILTFVTAECPLLKWIDLIVLGSSVLKICCSTTTTDVILNIPYSNQTVFSFLAVEKCSLVPGTQVRQASVVSFTKIIQCIYTRNGCDELRYDRCQHSDITESRKVNLEVFVITRQNIIIGLLVSILTGLVILGVILILYNRRKSHKSEYTGDNNTRMSAIYTRIDTTVNYDFGDDLEVDTLSVAYSTI